eukprot:4305040-Amphidinium_carterae.1
MRSVKELTSGHDIVINKFMEVVKDCGSMVDGQVIAGMEAVRLYEDMTRQTMVEAENKFSNGE